ncbi:hypothetical protein RIF29_38343 [Crotalaria pallida]|uniref:Uncharacterized protein n=1 Tax=Crotalaria pallida TaxID=3830 RepID=A0AAN9HPL9_CROPI
MKCRNFKQRPREMASITMPASILGSTTVTSQFLVATRVASCPSAKPFCCSSCCVLLGWRGRMSLNLVLQKPRKSMPLYVLLCQQLGFVGNEGLGFGLPLLIRKCITRSGTRIHDLGEGEILSVPAATNWAVLADVGVVTAMSVRSLKDIIKQID